MKVKDDILHIGKLTSEEFDKMEGTSFTFNQEQGEITGQVINSVSSEDLSKIISEVIAPYKAHISQLEEINRRLLDLIDRRN